MPDVNILPDPQPGDSRENYDRDLRPNPLAGANSGPAGPHPEKEAPTALDIKEFRRQFPEFSNDDLQQIVVMPTGARLAQGATYLDMRDPNRQEFTATPDMEATDANWYVPKTEVDYQLWNRLRGVSDPERIGEAADS